MLTEGTWIAAQIVFFTHEHTEVCFKDSEREIQGEKKVDKTVRDTKCALFLGNAHKSQSVNGGTGPP